MDEDDPGVLSVQHNPKAGRSADSWITPRAFAVGTLPSLSYVTPIDNMTQAVANNY